MTTRPSCQTPTSSPPSWASGASRSSLVSNEVGEGVHPPTEIGLRFRDLLGAVNQRIAAAADLVTLMVAGIPVRDQARGPRAAVERAR